MHRILLAATICGLAALATSTIHAQSLQETYAALCGHGQQGETCDALAKALDERQVAASKGLRGAPPATLPPDPVWGPLARLAGTRWVLATNEISTINQFEWIDGGAALRFTTGWIGAAPDMVVVFRPDGQPGVLKATIKSPDDPERKVRFRFDGDDGVLLSDWFHRFTFMGMGGSSERLEIRWSPDASYEFRHAMSANKDDRPAFPPLHGRFRRYSDTDLEPITAQSRAAVKALDEEVAERVAEMQRLEELESDENWGVIMGAVVSGFTRGLAEETADQQYAEEQFEDAVERGRRQGRAIRRGQQAMDTSAATAPAGNPEPSQPGQPEQPHPGSTHVGGGAGDNGKTCETVTKHYSNRSLPKPSRAEAERYIAQLPSMCALGARPSQGAVACTEDSEPVVTRDAKGIPRTTGRRTLYTCEAEMTCPPAQACTSEPGGGGSRQ